MSLLDATAAEFVPSFRVTSAQNLGSPNRSGTGSDTLEDSINTGTGHSSPYEDPTLEYVRLKMQITDLTSHRRQPGESQSDGFLRDLQRRLEEVKQDYLFDERNAEDAFKVEREKADASLLRARLRGDSPPVILDPVKKDIKKRASKDPEPPSVTDPTPSDVFDDEPDNETGGMFDLLEEPSEETTFQGTTIQIRDMVLPKNWSGRTPTQLLKETVHKLDRYAVVTYRCASGSSRAYRAAVSIRWEGRKNGDWVMEDIACRDLQQAEQYIATVALHALTFPETAGFALGGTAAASTQTSFRLLPAIYRDLWNELEEKRRANDDTVNRAIWGKLKQLLEPKLIKEKVCSFMIYFLFPSH